MGNWEKQQEQKKEGKERDKTRRENIAKLFLDFAKLTFTAIVLGGITPIYTHQNEVINWGLIIAGTIFTILFALIGNKILK